MPGIRSTSVALTLRMYKAMNRRVRLPKGAADHFKLQYEGREEPMRKKNGFSLIELLIAVAIILIIVAIAVPNLLKSKMAANEASAAASLRTISTANAIYSSTYEVGCAGSLAQLGPPSGACASDGSACADLLDSALSGVNPPSPKPIKNGYVFTYSVPSATPTVTTPNTTYSVTATPASPGSSGTSTFCLDQTKIVLKDPTGTATAGAAAGCSSFAGNPM